MKIHSAPLLLLLAAVAAPQAGFSQSPREEPAPPALDRETQKMCQREVKKICPVSFPPNRSAIQRCMKENKQKLPAPCQQLVQG